MSDRKSMLMLLVGLLAAAPAVNALTNPVNIDSKFRDPVRGCNAVAAAWLRAAFHEYVISSVTARLMMADI